MGKTIREWCEEAMLRDEITLTYTDKDGIVHTLTGNQRIKTARGYYRNNAILNVTSLDNGRSFYIEVKAYSSSIALLGINPVREEACILNARVTSSTDAHILSEVADTLSLMGLGCWYYKGGRLIGGAPIMYSDFKAVAKLKGHYSIRHDRPLLRKGGYR